MVGADLQKEVSKRDRRNNDDFQGSIQEFFLGSKSYRAGEGLLKENNTKL